MKLTNIKAVGRYTNPETGRPVNVKKGYKPGKSFDIYFFLRSGVRVYISEADFYQQWRKGEVKG